METLKFVVAMYMHFLIKFMCSCKGKSTNTVGKDSGDESVGLHCVYKQKGNCIQTGRGEYA